MNDANQTVQDLRQNMTVALARFQELDEKCISFLEAAENFPEITEVSLSKVVTMTTPLHIVTDGPPIFTPCRKLHGDKKTQVEE